MTNYTDADYLPLGIRITRTGKQALERVVADVGMSAPQFIEHVLARLLADGGYIKMEPMADGFGHDHAQPDPRVAGRHLD